MARPFRLRRLLNVLFDIELKLAMLALFCMMMVVVADVFMRYAFNSPIRGSFDLVGMCLVVMVVFGLPRIIADRLELAIELVDVLAPERVVRVLLAAAGVLSTLVLLFIVWAMINPAMKAYGYGDHSLELNVPTWIIWVLAIIGMASAALASVAAAFPASTGTDPKTDEVRFE